MSEYKAEYIAGLDLGQQSDRTALAIMERAQIPTGEAGPHLIIRGGGRPALQRLGGETREELQLKHLERPPLGTPYPALVAWIVDLLAKPPLAGATTLVMDCTGVGRPVYDLFRLSSLRAPLVAVTITGGDTATRANAAEWHIPKRDLVASLQVALQSGKLKVAAGLPLAETFRAEMLNFKASINLRGHDTYEAGAAGPGGAWREGAHDDIVLAVALACWYAERPQPRIRWIDYGE